MLKQFVKREDEEAFKQRVAITNHIVTTSTGNIMDVFYKVPRANYERIIRYEGADSDAKAKSLEDALKNFWGVKSLDTYQKTRWLEMNATDPNGFVVVEFQPFDNRIERAKPYPFEVQARQAVDYAYENNILTHLIVETDTVYSDKDGNTKPGKKYTVYLKDETFILSQVDENVNVWSTKDGQFDNDQAPTFFRSKGRVFSVSFSTPHNAGEVPAMQVGYRRDAWTSGKTHVSPYDAAVPLLRKSIKVNSELDLTMTTQVFPHRLQYMPVCKASGCLNGRLANGEICPECSGTGHSSISSAQEVIYFAMPKRGEEIIDLEKILVFKGPPIDVIKFQADYVERLTAGCKAVVFNSESFSAPQIHGTATGQMLDRDNVQDTLFSCSQGYADFWAFLVRLTAKFTDLFDGLDCRIVFSKDFKLKGMSELIADLQVAKQSGAGPAVVMHIQEAIARLIYSDSPEMFNRWKVKQQLNPFSGFSEDQVALALASPSVPQRIKTRFLMFGTLFSDLERENPNFYQLPAKTQDLLVENKVEAYMNESGVNEPPVITLPN